jgi:hypothetical protein
MSKSEKTLAKVSEVCLALPSAERALSGSHATYRVRGKVFAYFLDDHHGDGIVSVCVKSELGENVDRARRDPERYYLPAYIGPRGWFGLRPRARRLARGGQCRRAQLSSHGAEGTGREARLVIAGRAPR